LELGTDIDATSLRVCTDGTQPLPQKLGQLFGVLFATFPEKKWSIGDALLAHQQ
jgi:hypothetical protein